MRTLVSEDPHVFVAELLSATCENVRLGGTRAARAVGDACLVANLRQCRWRQRCVEDARAVSEADIIVNLTAVVVATTLFR